MKAEQKMKAEQIILNLKETLLKFIDITDEEYERFSSFCTYQHYKRREIIMEAGSVCDEIIYIGEGSVRYFHVIDGEEISGQFFFENGWYSDYESFLTGKPTKQSLQAIEKCDVLVIQKRHIYQLFDEIPKFERFGRIMAERAYLGLRTKTEIFTHLTPEERYLDLLKNRPKVIQRIPQHFIASYLGMKPQSLSRIRRRLQKKL